MTHPAQVGTRSLVPRRRSPTLQHQGSFLPLVPSTLLLSQEPCNNHQLSAYNLSSTGGCYLLFFKLHRTDTNPLEAVHLYLKHHRTQDFSPPLAESRYETVTKKIKYIYLNIFFLLFPVCQSMQTSATALSWFPQREQIRWRSKAANHLRQNPFPETLSAAELSRAHKPNPFSLRPLSLHRCDPSSRPRLGGSQHTGQGSAPRR